MRRGLPRGILVPAGVLGLVAAVPVTYLPAGMLGPRSGGWYTSYGPSNIVCLWLALMLLLIGANIAKMRGRRRDPGVQAWGREKGWTPGGVPAATLVRLQSGTPFTTQAPPYATEVISSRRGHRLAVSWTQRWEVGDADSRTEWRAHVVAVELPVSLPRVEVIPEGLADRAVTALGGQDVSVELAEFNRAYRVVTDDERVAHAVLHPRLVERLLQRDALPVRWRIEGRWIAAWTSGHTDVDRIEPWTRLLLDVVASLPRHVLDDHTPAGDA